MTKKPMAIFYIYTEDQTVVEEVFTVHEYGSVENLLLKSNTEFSVYTLRIDNDI